MFFGHIKFFFIFIVLAYITEGKVIFLRDYDEDPFIVEQEQPDRKTYTFNQLYRQDINPKQKKQKPKHATLHYGRHIYHLDSFDDLTKLRSELGEINTDYVPNGYVDLINDLIRSNREREKKIHQNYVGDVYIVSKRPISIECNDKHCEDGYRKSSKVSSDEDSVWQNKKMKLGYNKRFKIVDNGKNFKRQKKKKKYKSSEESWEKKKHYSASSSSESKESKESTESKEGDSREKESQEDKSQETKESNESKSSGSYEYKKKKKKYRDSSSRSSEERYTTKRPKRHDQSSSVEKWKNDDSGSKSDEDYTKRKRYDNDSDEAKRKAFSTDTILQGNKMYNAGSGKKSKKHGRHDMDRRRRLPHFLPKRYHWKPSEIHDLGYYWFNGPKGKFPGPTPLK